MDIKNNTTDRKIACLQCEHMITHIDDTLVYFLKRKNTTSINLTCPKCELLNTYWLNNEYEFCTFGTW